jgi:ABC-type multidrug transport system fused ATPase/permease subunit
VQGAITRLMRGRTVLIIAHRLKLAESADRIVVLENGRAIEAGTHADLLADAGHYRALVNASERVGT